MTVCVMVFATAAVLGLMSLLGGSAAESSSGYSHAPEHHKPGCKWVLAGFVFVVTTVALAAGVPGVMR